MSREVQMMTRTEYMEAVGINFDGVRDADTVADENFMEMIDRIAVAVQAFESEYIEEPYM